MTFLCVLYSGTTHTVKFFVQHRRCIPYIRHWNCAKIFLTFSKNAKKDLKSFDFRSFWWR